MKKYLLVLMLAFLNLSVFSQAVEKEVTTGKKFVESLTGSVSTVYEDATSVVNAAYNDIKEAVQYVTPIVEEGVKSLAKGLGTTATELFRILVKQQIVYAIVYTLVLFLILFLIWILYKLYNNISNISILFIKKNNLGDKDIATYNKKMQDKLSISYLLFGIILICVICLSIFFINNLTDLVMGYLNPEYGAIQEILNYTDKFINK